MSPRRRDLLYALGFTDDRRLSGWARSQLAHPTEPAFVIADDEWLDEVVALGRFNNETYDTSCARCQGKGRIQEGPAVVTCWVCIGSGRR